MSCSIFLIIVDFNYHQKIEDFYRAVFCTLLVKISFKEMLLKLDVLDRIIIVRYTIIIYTTLTIVAIPTKTSRTNCDLNEGKNTEFY